MSNWYFSHNRYVKDAQFPQDSHTAYYHYLMIGDVKLAVCSRSYKDGKDYSVQRYLGKGRLINFWQFKSSLEAAKLDAVAQYYEKHKLNFC